MLEILDDRLPNDIGVREEKMEIILTQKKQQKKPHSIDIITHFSAEFISLHLFSVAHF